MKTRALALLIVLIAFSTVNTYNYQAKQTSRTIDYIRLLKPNLDPKIAELHAKEIDKASEKWKVKKELIVSVAFRESEFNSCAVSSEGAVGCMQVLPRAHKDKIRARRLLPGEIFLLENNYDIGTEILHDLLKEKSLSKALRGYVGGSHPTYIADVRRNLKRCQEYR